LTDFLLFGKITSVYGKGGEVKVKIFKNNFEKFLPIDFCFVDFFGSKKKLLVQSSKRTGDSLVLLLEGFDSREASSILLEKEVFLLDDGASEQSDFSFLIKDLLESKVFANAEYLGKIEDVLSLPTNDVYVVHDDEGNEILIPALKELIDRFDKQDKILYLKVDKSYFEDDEN